MARVQKPPMPIRSLLPGLAFASAIALFAFALEQVQLVLLGRVWLDALVLAILLGACARSLRPVPDACTRGITFAAKPVMEWAVALMGATVGLGALAGIGAGLVAAIVALIALTIALGYALGRWLGLSGRMALLVACGNAICGNSAIAAVAPAIDADGDDVAASIGFTAVLGIAVVLIVPVLAGALHLDAVRGGMLAGLTVYAVPQVLAAAHPLGPIAVQVGALVKLVRVLMLGPVVTVLSLAHGGGAAKGRFFPLFILGFLALAVAHTAGMIPPALSDAAHHASLLLTVLAMAGLGLSVDLALVARAGLRVSASAVLCLMVLFAMAVLIVRVLA